MSKRAGIVLGAALGLALLVIAALATLVVTDGSDDGASTAADATGSSLPIADAGEVQPNAGAGGASIGNASTGGGNSRGNAPSGGSPAVTQPPPTTTTTITNQPPIVRDADVTGGAQSGEVINLQVVGHAIDPDGPPGQEVARVEVRWDGGGFQTATLGANDAFSADVRYPMPLYLSQGHRVQVQITAYDVHGAASETYSLQKQGR